MYMCVCMHACMYVCIVLRKTVEQRVHKPAASTCASQKTRTLPSWNRVRRASTRELALSKDDVCRAKFRMFFWVNAGSRVRVDRLSDVYSHGVDILATNEFFPCPLLYSEQQPLRGIRFGRRDIQPDRERERSHFEIDSEAVFCR